ncbi:MAG: rRNA maturation RNase YbeY [Gammaproteobacteria bacterium]|nr:rRNA maturation RNase YbeY [Gammaproteobacteria bacterium]NBT43742.1 rRNA maturation RNase YbeY [Gammaproteobacteria bacterium]NBY24121.1 rRNA maturation RNase YbeY [Gammaproteobacteria bacterium]NDE35008.1 rRNA maturation RNase YbeY [Gammaproteobacteria bacterium]NDE57034.1 rRNA maturation RNase YbeY [Gammaproteobacteria bacterium]
MIIDLDNVSAAPIPGIERFKAWAQAASREEDLELSIRIVDERECAELNRMYRQKEGPTNVLSFSCDVPEGVPCQILGDLVICAPVVEREALEQNKSLEAHWAHLVIHGILHLLGFDHMEEAAAEEMEALEIKILQDLGYTNPYEPQEISRL